MPYPPPNQRIALKHRSVCKKLREAQTEADREEERTQTKICLHYIRESLDETQRQKDKSGAKDRMEKLRKIKETYA